MTDNELAKMLLIYQYVFMTENPNKASKAVRSKMKLKLRHLLTHQEDRYNRAKEIQQRVYKEAWNNLFVVGEGTYISLGTFMTKLYNSIPKQNLVGHMVMKRMFDSYHHCESKHKLSEVEEADMESNAMRLAVEVLRLLGETVTSPLRSMRLNHKNNMIIEKG